MSALTTSANGVYVIAVTPFTPEGDIDFESIDRMVEFYVERGATGLTLLGMMGEAPKLTLSESCAVARRVTARVDGRMPVVVGVSAPGFAQMAELTRAVMADGAGGVMVAPPASLRTDDQILGYYRQVAEFTDGTPLVVQDFPLATGVQMSVPVLTRIFNEIDSAVCLKHEDWPGLEKISALREAGRLKQRISILCGNGGIFLPEEMGRGADGAMTGFAYPEMLSDVTTLWRKGEYDRARDLFDAYLPMARVEQQPGMGLAVRKYVLARRGAIRHDAQRRPGVKLSPAAVAEIETLIARQEKRLKELH
ncbi:MAG TPA: dihydrodipicolinate synthase family protein [Paracoccus sp. (in: a-proteobacteria)]|mgnify:CR=1 FL=1|uniref:dihydrodipicolinate synthase family protein n=1 Tax=uncultured Paracoccus sp. TaxID=189685 RepID=UPI00262C2AC1|nr:dihydrodipicolinate synthase family protein [uncultured Paracoccus sp.]HMQ40175.1 dihydrodipicolinate synthase family protein [Paracoccus sp. (in: a-proteobacteria)]HMR35147.1 dihydrodipicolinate synthase family protein [Paracoccus sp. (in: a-proteobacteria)]